MEVGRVENDRADTQMKKGGKKNSYNDKGSGVQLGGPVQSMGE